MQYIIRERYPAQTHQLQQQGLHPLLAQLFASRGIGHIKELSPEFEHLLAPNLLFGIDKAAEILVNAIQMQQKIVIVADYDCDGATACAVAMRGLRCLGAIVDYIVPNRFIDGYGLTPAIVQKAMQHPRLGKPDLLITVDNGIASVEGVDFANQHKLQVIVTDHHLPGDELPNAAAIVNPNQPKCNFPSKALAGVGVMFYVLVALRSLMRERGFFENKAQPKLDSLLDLVALGTVADVVSLDENNRRLVYQGLSRIKANRLQAGLLALFQVARKHTNTASTVDLAFAIAPRINAAGRLTDMSLGIECLITDNFERANELAEQLQQMNQERQKIEVQMQDNAIESLINDDQIQISKHDATKVICLYDHRWHQGVIGILAGRLKEKHHCPTIIFAPDNEDASILKGSGRSIHGVHLRDVLDLVAKRLPNSIIKFGGHAMAAGLTIHANMLEAFQQTLKQILENTISPDIFQKKIITDGNLSENYLQPSIIQLLETQIWGQGFPQPLFNDHFRVLNQRLLQEKHLKLQLKTQQGKTIDGIWFNRNQPIPDQSHLAYRPANNEYQGITRVQLIIESLLT